jgi:hypothetical protein
MTKIQILFIGLLALHSCKETKQETISKPEETKSVITDTVHHSRDMIPAKDDQNNIAIDEKIYPSDLVGTWAVICQNELTELDINKGEGFLSLYDFNAIYINLKVEKSSNKNEYLLKYASVSSQENYYDDHLKIIDDEISKDKVIAN